MAKKSSKNKSELNVIMSWYSNLSSTDKRILWSIISVIIIILLGSLLIETIRKYDEDISPQECEQKIREEVSYILALQEENPYLALIYTFRIPIFILLLMIAFAWILHGVGFHIIKR